MFEHANWGKRSNIWYAIEKNWFWNLGRKTWRKTKTCATNEELTHKSAWVNQKVHSWHVWYQIFMFKHANWGKGSNIRYAMEKAWFWNLGHKTWRKKKTCATNDKLTHKISWLNQKVYSWFKWYRILMLNHANRRKRTNLGYAIKKTWFWKSGHKARMKKQTCATNDKHTHKSAWVNQKAHSWLVWYRIFMFKHKNRSSRKNLQYVIEKTWFWMSGLRHEGKSKLVP